MLEVRPINKRLTELSEFQRTLIRTRLILYREGLGTTRAVKSWAGIAIDISTLPDSNIAASQSPEVHSNLKARWAYYAAVRPRRGVHKRLDEFGSGVIEFSIGEDALNRWCSKRIEPVPEVMAAVRDFLVLKRYLLEYELKAEDKALSVALALDQLADEIDPPQFHSAYKSVQVTDQAVRLLRLQLEPWPTRGCARLSILSREVGVHDKSAVDAENWFAQPITADTPDVSHSAGYAVMSAQRSIFGLLTPSKNSELPASLNSFYIRGTGEHCVSTFEIRSLASFSGLAPHSIRPPIKQNTHVYVSEENPKIFDFLNEIVYNYGIDLSIDFQNYNAWGIMSDSKSNIDGKNLYEYIKQWAKEHEESFTIRMPARIKVDQVVQAIDRANDVNYWSDEDNSSIVHIVCLGQTPSVLEAILRRDDVNLLRRDGNGRLACEYASALEDRTVKQAKAAGITNIQDFFFGPGTLAAAMSQPGPSFEP